MNECVTGKWGKYNAFYNETFQTGIQKKQWLSGFTGPCIHILASVHFVAQNTAQCTYPFLLQVGIWVASIWRLSLLTYSLMDICTTSFFFEMNFFKVGYQASLFSYSRFYQQHYSSWGIDSKSNITFFNEFFSFLLA